MNHFSVFLKRLTVRATLVLLFLGQLALAQSNVLKGDLQIPNLGVAKQEIKSYVASGRYQAEMAEVAEQARHYLAENLQRFHGEKPAMVLDIDETALSNYPYLEKADFSYQPEAWEAWVSSLSAAALPATLDLYKYAREKGVVVFFISARDSNRRELTEKNLHQAGYQDYQELILKDEGSGPSVLYKAAQRRRITEQGYAIMVNMGDQQSDLDGGYAEATFKLPNPMYFVP